MNPNILNYSIKPNFISKSHKLICKTLVFIIFSVLQITVLFLHKKNTATFITMFLTKLTKNYSLFVMLPPEFSVLLIDFGSFV